MDIAITFKNFEASDHLKKYVNRRFEKLGRFFGKGSDLDVAVTLSADKFHSRCEVNITGEGLHINTMEQGQDMYAAIDLVMDKLEPQIKKRVSRVKEQRRKARNVDVDVFTYSLGAEEEETTQIGTNRFNAKPMALEEAVMQLDAIGGEFFVFLNADSGRVNVVYHRRNGGYGLIDPII